MDPVEIEYLEWESEGSPVSIHMSPAVVKGITGDVIEGREQEVGGLLLGRVTSDARPGVRIERYQQIACAHASGPAFILDNGEIAALEDTAQNILAAGELAVVGLYRSHTRPGFQLEKPDFDLIQRYFRDPSDLILLIKANGEGGVTGQFHVQDEQNGARALSGEFPFRALIRETPEPRDFQPLRPAVPANKPAPERPRRLVPDFAPSSIEPSPSVLGLSGPADFTGTDDLTGRNDSGGQFRRWLPLFAALALVGGVLWFFLRSGGGTILTSSTPPPATEITRPLGLYVDPTGGQMWRVSWNPNATALHNARNVQLFVHENNQPNADDLPGDGQNRTLSARDLASGSYEYLPAGNDVTFRLEVTDQSGRVSAESFRVVRSANAPAPIPPAKPAAAPETGHIVQPKAVYRAPAVVAAGVRSRIKGAIPIDIRVQIDTHGHVVSATPVTRQHSGMDEYLAARAVQAAKQWRFEPARENGKPAPGVQILHFVFEK